MAQLTKQSLRPDFTFDDFKPDVNAWCRAEDKWLAELPQKVRKDWRENHRTSWDEDAVGTIMKWFVGDGFAQYIVVKQKPLTLSHIHIGDAYKVSHMMIRGCRLSDVRETMQMEGG